MIELKIKEYSIAFDKERKANTKDFIKMALDQPPQGGFNRDLLKKSDRIDKAIEKEKDGIIILEDQDIEFLKTRVSQCHWSTRSKDILDFLNIIDDLKSEKK